MLECGWCKTTLSPAKQRWVPRPVRYLAAVSAAFVHAGMWAMEWLSEPFCARCRAVVVPTIIGIATVELALVAFLVRLWVRH